METSKPKVSIVTITWGHEKFIEEALDGIFMQSYEGPIEFILSNDKSPDATDRVIRNYLSERTIPLNFKVKYTLHEKNLGSMNNFIWSLQQATGKYVAICEGDDYWIDKDKLQKQVDFLEKKEEYQMIFTNSQEISINKSLKDRDLITKISNSKTFSDVEIFTNWIVPTSSVVYRNIFKQKDWEILKDKRVFFGDIVLFLINCSKGKVYGLVDKTSAYRLHEGSLTNSEKSIEYYEKLLEHLEYLSKVFEGKYYSYVKNHIKQQAYKNFRFLMKKGNPKMVKYFLKYMKYA